MRKKDCSGRFSENEESDFWLKVDKSGDCWIYTGCLAPNGYGKFMYRKKHWSAHRLSYFFANDERTIPEGMEVCHKCDTPACVNPEHLFLGTRKENYQDMLDKNRHRFGEKAPTSKLTEAIVKEIRTSGRTDCTAMGKEYGVDHCTIRDVVVGKTWKHLL